MNFFELISAIIIFVILTINEINPSNYYESTKSQISPELLTNIINSLQTIAITYKKPIHICGINVNQKNLTLHNCNKDQQNWSNGILAYVDYDNSGHYNQKYENEKIYLIVSTTNSSIKNCCKSELIIDINGKFNKSCQLIITGKNFNTNMIINTTGTVQIL